MINKKEDGFIPVALLVGIVAVIGFIAIANLAPFKDKLLSSLYTKPPSNAASTAAVTITNTPSGGTVQTQLSTNNVWSGMVDQTPGAQTKLNGLKAPLVRIHAGDDGDPAAMPELKQGSWDFKALDSLVNNVFATGQDPLMNIKFAPDWQWTCTKLYSSGTVKDQTFSAYADYMARLVSYYNKGSMTTESGQVITNPAGTSHKITWWELWNEPDLNNETPCAPPSGVGLTSAQYLTMWNAVTPKMIAVDPSLKFAGPATAGSQFGSSNATGNQYVDDLMTGATIKPTALSFHGYGYWDNSASDKWLFDGDNSESGCCGGVADLLSGVNRIHSKYPALPVWITEVNVNAAWGDDPAKRPWSELGAAWWGAMFASVAPAGAGIIHHYDYIESPQFGLLDDKGNPFISYYVFQLLNQSFPQGSVLLNSNSALSGILTLAVQKPDKTISVLIVNRQTSSGISKCGTGGVASTIPVNLSGINATAITLTQIDKTNVNCSANPSIGIAPIVKNLDINQPISITMPGYGIAVLNIATDGQSLSTPTPGASNPPTPAPSTITQTPAPAANKVSGTIYLDANQNKKKDSGELGYSGGASIKLSGSSSATTVSSVTGTYSFTSLGDGSYTVNLVVPSGYKVTNTNPQTKTLTATNATANFGIAPLASSVPVPTSTPKPSTAPAATPVPTPIAQPPTSGSGLMIYDNALSSLFNDNTFSFSAKNLCDTASYTSASCSYAATFQKYGAFEFRLKTGTITATSYKSVDFNIFTNNQPITGFGVILATRAGGQINEYFLTNASVTQNYGNGWVHVSIPMTTLNPKNTAIGIISIENAKNASIPQIRVDDIILVQ